MRIDLAPTRELHQQLATIARARPHDVRAEIRQANQRIRERGIHFGGEKEMPIALSALLLKTNDVHALRAAAHTFHGILEQILDWLLDSPERLARHAGDHARLFPFLHKSKGSLTWQLFSRYDAVVGARGEIKIIEANTGCPAGFMHAIDFTTETRHVLSKLDPALTAQVQSLGMIRQGALIDLLLKVESESGLPPNPIAILMDENLLKLELDLIERELRRRGKVASIIDARDLAWDGTQLSHQGSPVSLAFNKLRISTPKSPNHCWKPGFEKRYEALLAATSAGKVALVNNLAALTIAEDKGLLALLFQDEPRAILSPRERDFIDETVSWTARWPTSSSSRHDDKEAFVKRVAEHKDEWVIKPAHEGRGYEVHVGRAESDTDWRKALEVDPNLPMVVQEFTEPLTLPVSCLRGDDIVQEQMHLTIALAVLAGTYEGILSRISSNIVTNVGKQGFVQAVLVGS